MTFLQHACSNFFVSLLTKNCSLWDFADSIRWLSAVATAAAAGGGYDEKDAEAVRNLRLIRFCCYYLALERKKWVWNPKSTAVDKAAPEFKESKRKIKNLKGICGTLFIETSPNQWFKWSNNNAFQQGAG